MLSHGGCCVCVGGLLSLCKASDAQLCTSAEGQVTHVTQEPRCSHRAPGFNEGPKPRVYKPWQPHATEMQQLPCARNYTQATLGCVAARQCTMGMCRVCDGCAEQPQPRRRRSEMLHAPNHRTPESRVPLNQQCCSAAVAPCIVPCTRMLGHTSCTLNPGRGNTPLLQCTQALQEPESPFICLQLASTSGTRPAASAQDPSLLRRQLLNLTTTVPGVRHPAAFSEPGCVRCAGLAAAAAPTAAGLLGVLAQGHAQHTGHLAEHLWVGDGFAALIVLDDLGLFIDELQDRAKAREGTKEARRRTH